MSYYICIPEELTNIISIFLDYTEINLLIDLYKIKVNYKYIIRDLYPAYFKIINFIRNISDHYKNKYQYSSDYDDINKYINLLNFKISNKDICEYYGLEYPYNINIYKVIT